MQLSVNLFVYLLSSKGTNQLQILYIKTLGNIQGNISTEAAVLKYIPSIFAGNLQKFQDNILKARSGKFCPSTSYNRLNYAGVL